MLWRMRDRTSSTSGVDGSVCNRCYFTRDVKLVRPRRNDFCAKKQSKAKGTTANHRGQNYNSSIINTQNNCVPKMGASTYMQHGACYTTYTPRHHQCRLRCYAHEYKGERSVHAARARAYGVFQNRLELGRVEEIPLPFSTL